MPTIAADSLALQRFYHWERQAPTRIALTQPMGGGALQEFSWAQIGEQVRRMASHLQALGQAQGWEPGAKVAILSKNCAWWLMSDLAIWMAGYVSVPLYPTLAPETIRQILTHSEARACFVGKLDGWEGMKPGLPEGLPCFSYPLSPADAKQAYEGWDAICARHTPLQGEPLRQADELATLIYTSGTTGAPKGVMHSFGAFAWAMSAALKRIPMGEQDRMLSYLPLAHVVERVLIEHGWLHTGFSVYFADSLDSFASDLQRARPTIFFSVPRLWVKFQQGVQAKLPEHKLALLLSLPLIGGLVRKKIKKALGLDQCRVAAGGAAPMPVALLDWYRRLGLPVNEGYGMTENLAVSHITLPGQNQTGSVGPTYAGVEARIAPENGELQMRSPALMLGYYKEPQLSAEAFTADGWLRTGDKGQIDAQGLLRITGRVKDLFKTSKGKYVAPAPIEDRLGQFPAIEACVVTGANMGQPVGIVMLSPTAAAHSQSEAERAALGQALATHLDAVNAKLDPHEQLDCVVVIRQPWTVDNGFITPTFKVKRNRVDEVYGPQLEAWVAQRKPVVWGD
ncbi:long-chain acyl-CoA synthetase [Paucibacter oligotrophus]|uniref:Long-chain acyl-CoA synthetase n=1 Tax=Roseateles oligotrophus TaxID=1769250 RepID=A0A840LAY6_9BURK|nr:AMP-binding protein [Roseateles oligotrophus]MBB4842517.1 long-chain acyl-CoA synthetase [Roseateles oligotrophus]